MPKTTSTTELQSIVAEIASFENGASVSELLATPNLDFKRRTLQRRLDSLCERGEIIPHGKARARRYFTPEKSREFNVKKELKNALQNTPKNLTKNQGETQDWLSDEAREIRSLVTLPPSKRHSSHYDSSFLTSYQPNTTYYLPQTTRNQLRKMGQVGLTDLPAGTYLRQILDRFLIDLSWNSSRLSGNSYSLKDTEQLLDHSELATSKSPQDAQIILNHKSAIEMLASPAETIGFTPYILRNLHALLSDNLMADSTKCGSLRTHPVIIANSVFAPLEIPEQIENDFLEILNKASNIQDPFEASFFMIVHLSYLQAFEGVNHSVSRLAANIPMIQNNLCPISFADVELDDYNNALTAVYELQRIDYLRDLFIWAYSRSTKNYNSVPKTLSTPDPFRLKYRSQIAQLVRKVVQTAHSRANAIEWINHHANIGIPEEDRTTFIDTVELELASLHEGNIARYQLRPAEFARWSVHLKRN